MTVTFRYAETVRDGFGERARLWFATEAGLADVYVEYLQYGGVRVSVGAQPDHPELEALLRGATQRVLETTRSLRELRRWTA